MPGAEDDETADGETVWYANALGPQEKNTVTRQCGPARLINGHYSVPLQWLNFKELTDEHAIFEVWETEQDHIAVTHLMDMPDLEWAKVDEEKGLYYMTREQYELGNEQM